MGHSKREALLCICTYNTPIAKAMSVLVLIFTSFLKHVSWRRKEELRPFSRESELVAAERKLQGKILQADLKSFPSYSWPQHNENYFRTPVF